MNDYHSNLIEKNGTGISESSIAFKGSGSKARFATSLIEKNGTGIRRLPLASAILAVVFAPMAMASELNGVVHRDGERLAISVTDGDFMFSGAGNSASGYAAFPINAIDLSLIIQSEGNGTGVSSEGNGTGVASEGNGTGVSSEGNGTGRVKSEGNGTGVTSEGNGTGVSSEGNGTGVSSEGNGTGISSEGNGTGVSSEGNGTGVSRVCLFHPRLLSEGNGTGQVKSEGNGTGVASEGNGTGLTSEGNGTGLTSEGNGTGVSSEGNGTGVSSFSYSATLPVDRGISLNPGECGPGSVMLSYGLAELALNGDTASVLLYGVARDGRVFEIGAAELPVVFQ